MDFNRLCRLLQLGVTLTASERPHCGHARTKPRSSTSKPAGVVGMTSIEPSLRMMGVSTCFLRLNASRGTFGAAVRLRGGSLEGQKRN